MAMGAGAAPEQQQQAARAAEARCAESRDEIVQRFDRLLPVVIGGGANTAEMDVDNAAALSKRGEADAGLGRTRFAAPADDARAAEVVTGRREAPASPFAAAAAAAATALEPTPLELPTTTMEEE